MDVDAQPPYTPLQVAEFAVLSARLDRSCSTDQFIALVEKLIEAAEKEAGLDWDHLYNHD